MAKVDPAGDLGLHPATHDPTAEKGLSVFLADILLDPAGTSPIEGSSVDIEHFAASNRALEGLRGPRPKYVLPNHAAHAWLAENGAGRRAGPGQGARAVSDLEVLTRNMTYAERSRVLANHFIALSIKHKNTDLPYRTAEGILTDRHLKPEEKVKCIEELTKNAAIQLDKLFGLISPSGRQELLKLLAVPCSPSMARVFGQYAPPALLPKIVDEIGRSSASNESLRITAMAELLEGIPAAKTLNGLALTLTGEAHIAMAKAAVLSPMLQARLARDLSLPQLGKLFRTILGLPLTRDDKGIALRGMLKNMEAGRKNALFFDLRRNGGLKEFAVSQIGLEGGGFNAVVLPGLTAENSAALWQALQFHAMLVSKDPTVKDESRIGRMVTELRAHMESKNISHLVTGTVSGKVNLARGELGGSIAYSHGRAKTTQSEESKGVQLSESEAENYAKNVRNYLDWKASLDLTQRIAQWRGTQPMAYQQQFLRFVRRNPLTSNRWVVSYR